MLLTLARLVLVVSLMLQPLSWANDAISIGLSTLRNVNLSPDDNEGQHKLKYPSRQRKLTGTTRRATTNQALQGRGQLQGRGFGYST